MYLEGSTQAASCEVPVAVGEGHRGQSGEQEQWAPRNSQGAVSAPPGEELEAGKYGDIAAPQGGSSVKLSTDAPQEGLPRGRGTGGPANPWSLFAPVRSPTGHTALDR